MHIASIAAVSAAVEASLLPEPVELDSATERFLNDPPVPERFDARQVRARAAALVERHLLRLNFDSFAVMVLKRAIEAIPAQGDA